jgi:bifunctional enzyme CysN/CysC
MHNGSHISTIKHNVSTSQRWRRNGHTGGILWLTGLSASGKSTLAMALELDLFDRNWQCVVIDGDNLRQGLCADLGFSPDDRAENVRRAGEMARMLAESGIIVIVALISPYQSDRDRIRRSAGSLFHEIWLSAGIDVCEARDPKNLYKKARAGEISEFTGISSSYEAPNAAELTIDTGTLDFQESLKVLRDYVERFTFL